jgi:hypothetical protein
MPRIEAEGILVRGTLWLDATGSVLRSLEYEYMTDQGTVIDAAMGGVTFTSIDVSRTEIASWWLRVPKASALLGAGVGLPYETGDHERDYFEVHKQVLDRRWRG